MRFHRIAASAVVAALAFGCGKVRDDSGDTTHTDGNGGDGNGGDGDDSGGSDSGGAASGGRNGAGSSGAGAGNGGAGGGTGSGSGGAPNGSGGTSSSGGASTGGTTSTGGNLNTGGAVVEEEGTQAMRAGPTVWIGQVESVVTYPELMTYDKSPQKATLILDRVGSGVTGTITFGSGDPPPIPTDGAAPYPPSAPGSEELGYDSNWAFCPHDGFAYSIVSSELRGNNLILSFVPLELFDAWCHLSDTGVFGTYGERICECDDDGCRGLDGPTRRIELVVSGDTLSGQLSRPPGNWLGETPALKLARIK